MEKKIILKAKKEESLKRFHPWVFSGAIARTEGDPTEGDLCAVYSSEGKLLARGHFALGSIALRVLSFGDEAIDEGFYYERLLGAWRLRVKAQLLRPEGDRRNNVYRLVHGEGDFLPGLVIDVYDDTAVMQAHSVGMHRERHRLSEALLRASREVLPSGLKAIYYKSENTLPLVEGVEAHDGFLYGHSEPHPVYEDGIIFLPDWATGQKTGFFVDQRENRALVERYAKGRRVLNAFSYTGGFSLYALRGGALEVASLDSSARAIYQAERQVEANFTEEIQRRHHAITEDAFSYLGKMPHEAYDLIILDPPAFAKHRKVLRNALIGYRRINAEAMRKLPKGGLLFTFSCSQAVSKEEFRLAVFTAAAQAGRKARILYQLTQPLDHPINIYHPEGEYLKGLVLEVE